MIYKFKVFPSTPLGCTVLHGFLEAVEPVSVGAGGAGGEKQGRRAAMPAVARRTATPKLHIFHVLLINGSTC